MFNLRNLHNLTKEDYMGFSGAENFPNGDEPVMAEIFCDDEEALIVIGGGQADIVVETDDEDCQRCYTRSHDHRSAADALIQIGIELGCAFRRGSVRSGLLIERMQWEKV